MVIIFGFVSAPSRHVQPLFSVSVRCWTGAARLCSDHHRSFSPIRRQYRSLHDNSVPTMSDLGSGNEHKGVVESSGKSKTSVADLRVAYSNEALLDDKIGDDPIVFFGKWFDEAVSAEEPEPNAMCLSTVDSDNRPSATYVLLKGYDERGFVWYTNYESRKAENLRSNEYAALTFWWASLHRSVRIEGRATKVEESESDAYFNSRPVGSRLGAWASDQSRPVESADVLQQRWQKLQSDYLDSDGNLAKPIERPPHWGGYRLRPHRIEFWKGRPARLHDRIVFEREMEGKVGQKWVKSRLQP